MNVVAPDTHTKEKTKLQRKGFVSFKSYRFILSTVDLITSLMRQIRNEAKTKVRQESQTSGVSECIYFHKAFHLSDKSCR